MSYKNIFMEHLDENGIKYAEKNESVIEILYGGEHMSKIAVYVIFDEDGEGSAQFKCWSIANFTERMAEGYAACNKLNAQYRWVKFYLDSDNEAACEGDAYFDEYNCGDVCLAMVGHMVSIADKSYPVFMKALYA